MNVQLEKMKRITGNWLTKSDRKGIVAEIWSKLEGELENLGFNLSQNIAFGLYRLTVRGDYDSHDRPRYEANFEYPEKTLKGIVQEKVISNLSRFLDYSMDERYLSDPPHSNVSSCVFLAYLDLSYQDKESSIKFRITPEFFHDKPHDFMYTDYSYGAERRLVVETDCRNSILDKDVREIYRGLRNVSRHKRNFNKTLNDERFKNKRQDRDNVR